ncbi:MAG: DegT/DnrJ/EryC1/StrS family aminotransferase [Chloroflexi bacterium]|nr:DegT/DnrJ/EryC1/StrS family aminotransferase [Chloroflexota bacterium]
MTNVHGAIGLAQLGKLEGFNRQRITKAASLTSALAERHNLARGLVRGVCSTSHHSRSP